MIKRSKVLKEMQARAEDRSMKISKALRAFNPKQVEEVRGWFLDGGDPDDMAAHYSVDVTTLMKVIKGQHPYTYPEDVQCLTFSG